MFYSLIMWLILQASALEYFLVKSFATYVGGVASNVGVFIWVSRVQNVTRCKAKLLRFELKNYNNEKMWIEWMGNA